MTKESRFNPFRVATFVKVTLGSSFLATQGRWLQSRWDWETELPEPKTHPPIPPKTAKNRLRSPSFILLPSSFARRPPHPFLRNEPKAKTTETPYVQHYTKKH